MVKERPEAYRILDLDASERPRERLANHGAEALSQAELLAILLRTGIEGENAVEIGTRLLQDYGGLQGLHRASFAELVACRGLGPAKAAQIKAAIELGRRLLQDEPEERAAIRSPQDAAALVQYDMMALPQEHLRVILLDTRNRVLGIEKLYIGSLNASTVRVAELFKAAIQRNAAAIILAHNHPSGDPSPSPEDAALTRAVVQAGKLLDIDVLDHIVIGGKKFISMKEKGLGFG